MRKWEYKRIIDFANVANESGELTQEEKEFIMGLIYRNPPLPKKEMIDTLKANNLYLTIDILNQVGKEGWELVHAELLSPQIDTYLFKRPIEG